MASDKAPVLTSGGTVYPGVSSITQAVSGNQPTTPETPSSDYVAMSPYWNMVGTILAGAAAMRNAPAYLPKFPNESDQDYNYRRANAKFTNIYRDIVENLAAKPFAKEVKVIDKSASEDIKKFIEDIDGKGNHLHVFAAHVFFTGINNAVDWILVDKQPVPDNTTKAAEKALGVRPYWVHVNARDLLAVYSDMVEGKEQIVHARIHEPVMERSGYAEIYKNRVRILNRNKNDDGTYDPATWEIWEETKEINTQRSTWKLIDEGKIGIKVIALVPFITGRRENDRWLFVPPMQDAAYLQIEHFQQETNLKSIKEQAAFPMLSGNGVEPPIDEAGNQKIIPVGPKTVLFAPPKENGAAGSWSFIEPAGSSLTFLAKDVEDTEKQLRELGRQPLTAQSGNLTVITTAFAAQKGNSAIEAWAMNLKDALEQALMYTCLWMGDKSEPEIDIYTDFALDLESDAAPNFLLSMRNNKDISRKALIAEAKRRDYLSPEYDADEDMKELQGEMPADPTAEDLANSMGGNVRRLRPNPRMVENGDGLDIEEEAA